VIGGHAEMLGVVRGQGPAYPGKGEQKEQTEGQPEDQRNEEAGIRGHPGFPQQRKPKQAGEENAERDSEEAHARTGCGWGISSSVQRRQNDSDRSGAYPSPREGEDERERGQPRRAADLRH
jgi:hypothetical protein